MTTANTERRAARQLARRAFSLVEIMVVIVIIGLLAGVVTVNVRNYLTRARQNVARHDISTICRALDMFWADHARYPSGEEGLDALTRPAAATGEAYLARLPMDPWGHPYQYGVSAAGYDVRSLGADRREGGSGADADITNQTQER